MRLKVLESGHRLRHKALLTVIGVVGQRRVSDIVRTLFYRPEFLGHNLNKWTHLSLRGSSQWSVGERELFAAFTSKINSCPF